jgi:hypothetical protein
VVKNVAFYPNRSYLCLCPTEIVLLRSQRKKEKKVHKRERERERERERMNG